MATVKHDDIMPLENVVKKRKTTHFCGNSDLKNEDKAHLSKEEKSTMVSTKSSASQKKNKSVTSGSSQVSQKDGAGSDFLKCGQCGSIFHKLQLFVVHKTTECPGNSTDADAKEGPEVKRPKIEPKSDTKKKQVSIGTANKKHSSSFSLQKQLTLRRGLPVVALKKLPEKSVLRSMLKNSKSTGSDDKKKTNLLKKEVTKELKTDVKDTPLSDTKSINNKKPTKPARFLALRGEKVKSGLIKKPGQPLKTKVLTGSILKKTNNEPPKKVRPKVINCGKCEACLRESDCGECSHCRDKPRFGGPNRIKKKCRLKICIKNLKTRKTPLSSSPSTPVTSSTTPLSAITMQTPSPLPLHIDDDDLLSDQAKKKGFGCGECPGCLRIEDCGECQTCLDEKHARPNSPKKKCLLKECEMISGERVYQVEKVLGKRFQNGRLEYLLKWKGYPNSENCWEPEENILSRDLIEEFERSNQMENEDSVTEKAIQLPEKRQWEEDSDQEAKKIRLDDEAVLSETDLEELQEFGSNKDPLLEALGLQKQSDSETPTSPTSETRKKRTSKQAAMNLIKSVCDHTKAQDVDDDSPELTTSVLYIPKPDEPGKYILVMGEQKQLDMLEKANLNPKVILGPKSKEVEEAENELNVSTKVSSDKENSSSSESKNLEDKYDEYDFSLEDELPLKKPLHEKSEQPTTETKKKSKSSKQDKDSNSSVGKSPSSKRKNKQCKEESLAILQMMSDISEARANTRNISIDETEVLKPNKGTSGNSIVEQSSESPVSTSNNNDLLSTALTIKRGPGRPPKVPRPYLIPLTGNPPLLQVVNDKLVPVKRGRGRPRKSESQLLLKDKGSKVERIVTLVDKDGIPVSKIISNDDDKILSGRASPVKEMAIDILVDTTGNLTKGKPRKNVDDDSMYDEDPDSDGQSGSKSDTASLEGSSEKFSSRKKVKSPTLIRKQETNLSKIKKNRVFVVMPDGTMVEVSGSDRQKAIARATAKVEAINKGEKSKETSKKKADTRPLLEECTLDIDDSGTLKLPNTIQLVESELPLGEAENAEKLIGMYLFRQVYSPNDPTLQCLFCRGKYTLRFPVDLEKHYHVVHELAVQSWKAEFSENIVFVCVPSDVTEDTTLNSACRFCEVTLKTLCEVREHYPSSHEKIVRLVPESAVTELGNSFYCSICSCASEDFVTHHKHMKSVHRMQTYVCRYCSYCTSRPSRLRTHVKQRHLQEQPGPHLQCSVCSVYVHGKERLNKHILLSHAVQTGPQIWSCAKCLQPCGDARDLMGHISNCPLINCEQSPQEKETAVTNAKSTLFYKCNNCSLTFSSEEEIKKHMADGIHAPPEEIIGQLPQVENGENSDDNICFICCMRFTSRNQCNHHQHHVHMRWVDKKTVDYSEEEGFPAQNEDELMDNPSNENAAVITQEILSQEINKNESQELDTLKENNSQALSLEGIEADSLLQQVNEDSQQLPNALENNKDDMNKSSVANDSIIQNKSIVEEEDKEKKNLSESTKLSQDDAKDQNASIKEVRMCDLPTDNQLAELGFPAKIGHYCHLCDAVIKSYALYYLHMHNLHDLEKRFQCIISACGRTFRNTAAFQRHAMQHNQKSESFCSMCDMVFGDNEVLQEHLLSPEHANKYMKVQEKYNRTEPRNYRCKVCHSWFGLFATFVKHMETESHQYQCQHCGLLFVQPGPRRNHIQSIHPELANVCEICGSKMQNSQALWSHLSSHSIVHECQKCHRRFLQREQLMAHMEVHAPPTPCPWEGCNRKLATKVGLYNHLRMHRGDTDYKCSICTRGFFKKKSLESHMKTHDENRDGKSLIIGMRNQSSATECQQQAQLLQDDSEQLTANVELVQLICAGCLNGFDSEDQFAAHICTGQADVQDQTQTIVTSGTDLMDQHHQQIIVQTTPGISTAEEISIAAAQLVTAAQELSGTATVTFSSHEDITDQLARAVAEATHPGSQVTVTIGNSGMGVNTALNVNSLTSQSNNVQFTSEVSDNIFMQENVVEENQLQEEPTNITESSEPQSGGFPSNSNPPLNTNLTEETQSVVPVPMETDENILNSSGVNNNLDTDQNITFQQELQTQEEGTTYAVTDQSETQNVEHIPEESSEEICGNTSLPMVQQDQTMEEENPIGMEIEDSENQVADIVMMVPDDQGGDSQQIPVELSGDQSYGTAVLNVPTSDGTQRVLLIPISSTEGGNTVLTLPSGITIGSDDSDSGNMTVALNAQNTSETVGDSEQTFLTLMPETGVDEILENNADSEHLQDSSIITGNLVEDEVTTHNLVLSQDPNVATTIADSGP
ncbi:uncharacterized protein [Centruroides vittatus]|uniref:uncharacterized protein isoform X3 n=1 Tax=Centruroides vittatus TaxID=120091 RepID=UPI003510A372